MPLTYFNAFLPTPTCYQTCTKPEVHTHCLLSGYSAVTPQKEHLLGNTKCSVLPMLFTVLMGKSILELFKYSLAIQLSQASGNSTAKTGPALLIRLLSLALKICTSYTSTTVLPSTSILLVHRPKLGTTLSLLPFNRLSKKQRNTQTAGKYSAGLQSSVQFG